MLDINEIESTWPCGCKRTVDGVYIKCKTCMPDSNAIPKTEVVGYVRQFSTGATRDTSEGKLEYNGFNCPLVEKRFAEYMHKYRVQPDGKLRTAGNWKLGIPVDAYMQSLHRHFEDLWLHMDGYPEEAVDPDVESVLCAIRFNVNGMLHEIVKKRKRVTQ